MAIQITNNLRTPLNLPDLQLNPIPGLTTVELPDNAFYRNLVAVSANLASAIAKAHATLTLTNVAGSSRRITVPESVSWLSPVINILAEPPESKAIGDRYYVLDGVTPSTNPWYKRNHNIAEWDGEDWVFTQLRAGATVYIETLGKFGSFNGVEFAFSGTGLDHGDLLGLDHDDHPQYASLDGSRPFTGPVTGVAPTEDDHLTTKGYVDETIFETGLDLAVRNESGALIAKGTPVYIDGWDPATERALVGKARADTLAKMPAVGIMLEDTDDGENGVAQRVGLMTGLDMGMYSAGDFLWVAATGGLTDARPGGDNLVQKIAQVINPDPDNGSIVITGAGRTNATPNLALNHYWVGTDGPAAEQEYQGTSFPLTPVPGHMFYRQDLLSWCVYNHIYAKWFLAGETVVLGFSYNGAGTDGAYLSIRDVNNSSAHYAILRNYTIVGMTLSQTNAGMLGAAPNTSGVIVSLDAVDLYTLTLDDTKLSRQTETLNIDVAPTLDTAIGLRARFTGLGGGGQKMNNTVFDVALKLRV